MYSCIDKIADGILFRESIEPSCREEQSRKNKPRILVWDFKPEEYLCNIGRLCAKPTGLRCLFPRVSVDNDGTAPYP